MIKKILFIFFTLSLLASCQEGKFVKYGAFTHWSEVTRGPASVNNHSIQEEFIKFQDPNQIAIYCLRESAKPKTCYLDNFNKTISSYESEKGSLGPTNLKIVTETFEFEKVHDKLLLIFESYKAPFKDNIKNLVQQRKSFCMKNAEHDSQRCMTHYLEKDTFQVLNKINSRNKMNGAEYLFIKSNLKNHLKQELSSVNL